MKSTSMNGILKNLKSNMRAIELAKFKIYNHRKLDEKKGIKIGKNYIKKIINNPSFKKEFEQALHYLECEPIEDIDLILSIADSNHESDFPLNEPLNQ